ncbi:hypothetical protein DPMN_098735 [Dreissena polymorpha]|uniref:Uncharacterized protein n=1 Tax=Dreissena polymorpha TaxID=45954 RepID=A0A9D4R7J9_DREPO|nr:hypothetical protein DPMN_098735 [Dreissena polymorpha]
MYSVLVPSGLTAISRKVHHQRLPLESAWLCHRNVTQVGLSTTLKQTTFPQVDALVQVG